jgi:hypothetical protein
MGIALVIDVKEAGLEMNRTATLALLAHTTNALQSITHSTAQYWTAPSASLGTSD